ncbi:uncharacterized protein LOC125518148 [Triticum urartu]|uniref:uncharacterized protein LOC125518148 n=1 Tax=Triticum urartu TaxID=4572 RepID=UPI00204491B3|nr:uncharacterized protein LOC125518148 [Triticum urartu]
MHLVMAGVVIQSTFLMLASSLCCNLLLRRWTSATSRQFLKFFLQPVESYMMCKLAVLLNGRSFARARKVMVDSHEEQRQIMFERFSFVSYVSAQKAYIEALDGWLSKFILTDTICYSRGISLIAPDRAGTPPLVVITSGTPCCRRLDRSSALVSLA